MIPPLSDLTESWFTMNIDLETDFSYQEFECPCCRTQEMDDRVIIALQAIRTRLSLPFVVYSAFRCQKHNAYPYVGGAPGSYHLKGLAVDIAIDPVFLHQILRYAPMFFNGIGLYHDQPLIHLDMRPDPLVFVR